MVDCSLISNLGRRSRPVEHAVRDLNALQSANDILGSLCGTPLAILGYMAYSNI
jgi:hypothetical protein